MPSSRFFEIYQSFPSELPLAMNIKSDGLQQLIREAIEKYQIKNYFLFDMSVPDGLAYVRQGGFHAVLFVSHNMTVVNTLCNKGLVLQNGKMAFLGSASDAINIYSNCF